MKKPSEWTPQEAWKHACDEAAKLATALWNSDVIPRGKASADLFQTAKDIQGMPFPSDPVWVSDECLRAYASAALNSSAKEMALELIERRKGDKEQGK